MEAVTGWMPFGALNVPVVAVSPAVLHQLRALDFTPGEHAPSELATPTVIIEPFGELYRTLIVEVDEHPDEVRARLPRRSTRHDAPVPGGGFFDSPSGAVHAALSTITERLVRAEPDSTHLHAGAVAIDDHGILFPASSGSGKTTLVSELGRHGFVLSDELVGVDHHRSLLHAAKRPLSIKQAGFSRATSRYPHLEPPAPDEFVWHVPLDAIGLGHQSKTTPRAIALIERRDGPTIIEPVDPLEVLMTLLTNAYDLDVDHAKAFDNLVWLAETCVGWRVGYEEADRAAPVIARQLERELGPRHPRLQRIDTDGRFGVSTGDTEVWWNPISRDLSWIKA